MFQSSVVVTVDQFPVAFVPVVPVGSQYSVAARAEGAVVRIATPANSAMAGMKNFARRLPGATTGPVRMAVEAGRVETGAVERRRGEERCFINV